MLKWYLTIPECYVTDLFHDDIYSPWDTSTLQFTFTLTGPDCDNVTTSATACLESGQSACTNGTIQESDDTQTMTFTDLPSAGAWYSVTVTVIRDSEEELNSTSTQQQTRECLDSLYIITMII